MTYNVGRPCWGNAADDWLHGQNNPLQHNGQGQKKHLDYPHGLFRQCLRHSLSSSDRGGWNISFPDRPNAVITITSRGDKCVRQVPQFNILLSQGFKLSRGDSEVMRLNPDGEMNRPTQISYVLLAIVVVLIAWLNLGTFLLTSLFGYLALQVFTFRRSKALSVAFYFFVVIVVSAGLLYFASLAYRTLPKIAEMAIPAMVEFAEKNGIDLPFTDYTSLKNSAVAEAVEGLTTIGRYARIASFQSVLLLAGLVVALSIFLNPSWTASNHELATTDSIYLEVTRELSIRFKNLYQSFARVIGAQIVISGINTALTGVFLVFTGYPFSELLLCLVFLCGLIPIVGNLISNTVIVGVGFTISPRTGLLALVFLITIHKLEYFLNSKIIGKRIDSPMWLTLIGLLVGERLMGIPGMILAPVVLNYIKVEASNCRHSPEETTVSDSRLPDKRHDDSNPLKRESTVHQ